MVLFLHSNHFYAFGKDAMPLPSTPTSTQSPPQPPSPISSSSSSSSRISPAVLFIIVILAVIFFISGLLHLLVRFLTKKNPSSSSSARSGNGYPVAEPPGSDALQRQLQQLFHLHDSGLDQAFIDALPIFLYREVVGPKEPFDCAVCLCEFGDEDRLRLLPLCGHAFHLNCIDTWLLSNSTCPLCRGALFVQGLAIENPIFDFENLREEEEVTPGGGGWEQKESVGETRVFPVRLGKFRRLSNDEDGGEQVVASEGVDKIVRREVGESSGSNLDARRCYSLGSYQYVVGNADLRVALSGARNLRDRKLRGSSSGDAVDETGRKIGATSRGESFSMSKIWMWPSKKGKLPGSSNSPSLPERLSWMGRHIGDT